MYLDKEIYAESEREMVEYLNSHYEYCYLQSMHYLNSRQKTNTIITGLSYGLDGLESTLLNGNVLNFSMHSQDLYYDFLHIKKAVEESENSISQCVLTMGYYSLFYDLSLSNNGWKCLETYGPLFGDMHNANTTNVDMSYFMCDVDCENFYHSFFEKNRSYYGPAITREYTSIEISEKGGWSKLESAEKDSVAYELAQKHNKHIKHEETFKENKEILNNILKFLKEKNIRVIVLILPFSKEYLKYIDCNYKTILLSVLDELTYDMEVDFVDMNDMEYFSEADFLDSDHLNYKGALKATVLLNGVLNHLF